MPNMPNVYTTQEAASILKIAPRTIREWITNGYIKAFKLNPKTKSVLRIPMSEVDRVLRERNGQTTDHHGK